MHKSLAPARARVVFNLFLLFFQARARLRIMRARYRKHVFNPSFFRLHPSFFRLVRLFSGAVHIPS